MPKNNLQFDIVLFGATSFVGRLVAQTLCDLMTDNSPCLPTSFRCALVARDIQRLKTFASSLNAPDDSMALIAADAQDFDQLHELCLRAKVIISTVGPYALYGEKLVRACVDTGTDYCDLTGEVQWIKKMIARYDQQAQTSGARIVHCCGFDSLPSDLSVFRLQTLAQESFGTNCSTIKLGVKRLRGGFSGGTIASMINVAKEAIADKNLRRELADPYSLCPPQHGFHVHQAGNQTRFDADFNSWVAPFVMAAINTRVVHRSNALLNYRYGKDFRYSEVMLMGSKGRWKSYALSIGLSLFTLLIAFALSRWLLQRLVLPRPGTGPSVETQRQGYFEMILLGITNNNQRLKLSVRGEGDPGYSATARMLVQAGLCLATDLEADTPGGFYTPTALLGNRLLSRLTTYAKLNFTPIND